MKPPHLYLTGYRGCGKSTVAKRLSTRLNMPLCDLDRVIETTAGVNIAEIFASSGEAGFRAQEANALFEVARRPPHVVALGGGAILRAENRQTIRDSGWCVWLDADPGEIATRLSTDQRTGHHRPSLTDLPAIEEIITLMKVREPLYREAANLRIDTTGRDPESIVDEIIAAFPTKS